MESQICVNNLPLPNELISLIRSNRWRCPSDLTGVNRCFPNRGELHLYSVEEMEAETATYPVERTSRWLGTPDAHFPPGDLDPTLFVLVGDLGLGYDQPIALDYRVSMDHPRVLTLIWSQRPEGNRWIEVAANIHDFAELIGL